MKRKYQKKDKAIRQPKLSQRELIEQQLQKLCMQLEGNEQKQLQLNLERQRLLEQMELKKQEALLELFNLKKLAVEDYLALYEEASKIKFEELQSTQEEFEALQEFTEEGEGLDEDLSSGTETEAF